MGGGWWEDVWSDKTKVILNSTQFKLKLKLELSLAIGISSKSALTIRHFDDGPGHPTITAL